MRFFNTSSKINRDPPSSTGASPLNSVTYAGTTAAPTLQDINGTSWNPPSAKDAPQSGRGKYGKVSKRSSMDGSGHRHKDKSRTILRSKSDAEYRSKPSSGDRALQDPTSKQRAGSSDPPSDIEPFVSEDRKEKKKKKKRQQQQDAHQEGVKERLNLSSSTGSGEKGGSEHGKSVKDASFRDVLNNLNSDAQISANTHKHQNNPFVVPSSTSSSSRSISRAMPTLDENEQDKNASADLDFSKFKSSDKSTSALQTLLENANNFSSDCSVGTVNTTTQCALSLGHLIEEMQAEFQKIKKQKNKAESYAEKLHTDYVRMQEGLERDYEKACEERDNLKIAREKDAMVIEKLREELKAAKSENFTLRESMETITENSRKSEEENGRMKIALEALLVRSGALNKSGRTKQRRSSIDHQEPGTLNKRPSGSLPGTPDREVQDHASFPKSADCVKTMLGDSVKDLQPQKAAPLPFDFGGKRRSSKINRDMNEILESSFNSISQSLNKDEDGDASVISVTTKDDGTIDSPIPR